MSSHHRFNVNVTLSMEITRCFVCLSLYDARRRGPGKMFACRQHIATAIVNILKLFPTFSNNHLSLLLLT